MIGQIIIDLKDPTLVGSFFYASTEGDWDIT